MHTFTFPTHNKKIRLLFVSNAYGYVSDRELERVRKWIFDHWRHWPRNLPLLKKSFPLSFILEELPAVKTTKKLVLVLTQSHDLRTDEIELWNRAAKFREFFLDIRFQGHISRMKKDLLMLL